MKKIIALLLSLVMMLPAAAFAAADGNATETVVADFEMNADEGFSAGNLVSYSDPSLGTYYKAANTRASFQFSQEVTEGVLVIEYDFNNLGNPSGGNYNTVHAPGIGAIIYKHETWADTGKWVHFKHEIDIEAKTIKTYKADDTEGTTVVNVSGLGSGVTISNIAIDSWHAMGFGIDNLVITNVIGPVGPCSVTAAEFEGKDGVVLSEISEIRSGVVAVHLNFSGMMVEDTVVPSLLCDGSPVELGESIWNENVLRISPASGEFEYEKEYTLTVPAGFTDVKGGVAEEDYVLTFECVNFSGVIAYYDMEIDKGGITGAYNTREFALENDGNIYLKVRNDRCTFEFDEAATSGTLTIEFDYKNVDSDGNYSCSARLDSDGRAGGEDPILFTIGGTVGAGEWVKYKVIADIDNDIVEVYYDGILRETVSGKGLNNLPCIMGLGFERWQKNFGFDNVKVYYGNSGIKGFKYRDFGGNRADSASKLTSALDCIEVEFENEPEVDSLDVTLYNEKTAQYENVVLNASGRNLEIRPEKGYFDVSSDYIMALPAGYTNKYGYAGNDALEISFNTGSKVFGVMSVNIKKDGRAVSLSDINAGDTVDVEVNYVMTTQGAAYDVIIALTTEKNFKLTSFDSTNATMENSGVNTVKYSLKIADDSEFDAVYASVWDLNTRVPQIDCATVK